MRQEHGAGSSARLAALEQRIAHLERIIEISQTLNTTLELNPLLETITRVAVELTETVGCAILLLDRETGELRVCVATAPNRAGLVGQTVPLDSSIAGQILQQQKPVLIQNVRDDPRHFKAMDEMTAFETRSLIGVPLKVREQTIGVLEAVNKKGDREMSWADVELLSVLADQAAVAIENARLYDDIRGMIAFNEGLVQSLAEGIIVTNAQGYTTFVNPAVTALTGYAAEELIEQHWSALVPPDQQPIVAAAFERRERGETDRYRLELLRKDGGRTPVLVSGSPYLSPGAGRFSGSVAVFTDITQALEHQKMEQELALAWQIQSSFLPHQLPQVPGWQLAATLEPAQQTSGDFYDLIPLLNGRLGVLIADVAGKGIGAALYMAVSRTLLRTYAIEYHEHPGLALRAANRRLWRDTQAEVFITAFFGVLDPFTGTLTYCNAGHNPPLFVGAPDGATVLTLDRTGMPLGTFEDLTWEQRTVQLAPGDLLLLYTDGIVDAEDDQGRFFGTERLLRAARANIGRSAEEIQEALLQQVRAFIGAAPAAQRDDIAIVAVIRGSRHDYD